MAPNFDNNIALISRGYPSALEQKNDLFIHDFNVVLCQYLVQIKTRTFSFAF